MDLKQVIGELLESSKSGRDRRIKFYEQPMQYLNTHADGLSNEDRAILFSMDRKLIADHVPARAGDVDLHLFSGHWPAQGEDWPAPRSDEFSTQFDRREDADGEENLGTQTQQAEPLAALAGGGGGGGGGSAWSDPGPHGRGFRPASGSKNSELTIILVGEGFLDKASVVFEHVDWSADNGGPFKAKGVHTAYKNFRRCYLKCTLKIGDTWTPGAYTVTIQNDPDKSGTHIKAGHLFHVEK